MKPNQTTYCALFEDGSYIEKDTFEEIGILPNFFILLQIVHVNSYDEYKHYYQFKPLTREGKPSTIRIGNFEIIDIGPQKGTWNFAGMTIKIFDHNSGMVHEYKATSTKTLEVFKNELFPLLNHLNELGSWKNYQNYQKVIELQKENDNLAKQIQSLKEKIKQLEEDRDNPVPKE